MNNEEIDSIKRQMELSDADFQKQFRRNSKKLQIADYALSLDRGVKKFIKFAFANLDYYSFAEIVSEYKKANEKSNTKTITE